ncbi:hypothetical protein J7E97_04860 [Streptomyces sp. ISL-66]|uniref:DUF5682 family protein n=1 Tax=Streptomyces sp. ISL-66 TaxID=2819186 RepID=UPI001BEB5E19|nr:DUF5682 family protein [Streptomyces sp. ISL-66]MBT2467220.1 hypothetical protein [Streptomyces sp. ISL-66]
MSPRTEERGPLLLGVRHHGPGSARAVRAALDAAQPAAVLIEGPPEGDALLPLAADPGMRPPVALLAHVADDPGRAAFWPLAGFSPEWAAIRWAQARDVPVRFIDLPAAHSLAPSGEGAGAAEAGGEGDEEGEEALDSVRLDPLAVLAATAGYDDPERWWEDVVEHRGGADGAGGDPLGVFEALGEAMGALREEYGAGGHHRDLVREAYMRQRMRAARREFGDGYAVVCGAWHVPALRAKTTAAADKALLAGLPKVKVETTWVPWTHRRLARAGGYGAGITSPGWYAHLFAARDRPVERWLTKVAGLLREEDRQVSPAHVIEAVRLADTLAAMRGRPVPGLTETLEAVRAVMCEGSDIPLALIEDRLVVGDVLGEVPDAAPVVPLQRDVTRHQRSLRLKAEAQDRELELDLRKDTDAAKSLLLHRLRLLGIDWGVPVASRGSTGTFRETWRLRWEPELAVRVAEAGIWGTTVLGAATARAEAEAAGAEELGAVTALAERCLLAGLSEALPAVLRALADRAALDTDVAGLAKALPALARSLRYGDVRGTDAAALGTVAAGLAERICVALPPACAAGLDADAAAELRAHVDAVHGAIGLLGAAGASGGAEVGVEAVGVSAGCGVGVEEAGVSGGVEVGVEAAGVSGGSGVGVEAVGVSGGCGVGVEAAGASGGSGVGVEAAGVSGGTGAANEAAGASGGADLGIQAAGTVSGAGAGIEAAGASGGADAGIGAAATSGGAGVGIEAARAPGGTGVGAEVVGVDAGADGLRERWSAVLRALAGRDTVPGLIRGRAARLLLDDGRLPPQETARLMGLSLSPASAPADAAGWIEGFAGGGSGGGTLLVHDERLLRLIDGWLVSVPERAFVDVLPLLRRTFGSYEPGVKRTLGELARRGPAVAAGHPAAVGSGSSVGAGFGAELDAGRADAVVDLVRLLLAGAVT